MHVVWECPVLILNDLKHQGPRTLTFWAFVAFLCFTLLLRYSQCRRQHVTWRHLENVDRCRQILQIPQLLRTESLFWPLCLPLIANIMQSNFSWELCWWCTKQNRIYFAWLQVNDTHLEHWKNIDLSVNVLFRESELLKTLYLHSWISKHSYPLQMQVYIRGIKSVYKQAFCL